MNVFLPFVVLHIVVSCAFIVHETSDVVVLAVSLALEFSCAVLSYSPTMGVTPSPF
jgi:hypothetical protein